MSALTSRVLGAHDDRRRRGDLAVARRQRRRLGAERDEILGVGAELPGPEQQRQPRAARHSPAGTGWARTPRAARGRGWPVPPAARPASGTARRGRGRAAARVVPGDAARPGMADRREQHQAARELGRLQRHREPQHARERMDDDDRLARRRAPAAPRRIRRLAAAARRRRGRRAGRCSRGRAGRRRRRETPRRPAAPPARHAGSAKLPEAPCASSTAPRSALSRRRLDDMQPAGAEVDADGRPGDSGARRRGGTTSVEIRAKQRPPRRERRRAPAIKASWLHKRGLRAGARLLHRLIGRRELQRAVVDVQRRFGVAGVEHHRGEAGERADVARLALQRLRDIGHRAGDVAGAGTAPSRARSTPPTNRDRGRRRRRADCSASARLAVSRAFSARDSSRSAVSEPDCRRKWSISPRMPAASSGKRVLASRA